MADSTSSSSEDKGQIICPLCLMIAIKSDGRCGSIQSYRCLERANGWETRPQKTDKWADDFFKVLNTPKGEPVMLSDGETELVGLGKGSDAKVFKFTQQDGERAFERAMQEVKSGHLRAPRTWDKTWAPIAGVDLEELKRTYPDLYAAQTRASSSRSNGEDEDIQPLGSGFFDEAVIEGEEPAIESEGLTEEDDNLIAQEEDSYEDEPAYSVVAELGLEDEEIADTQASHDHGKQRVITINFPTGATSARVDRHIQMLRIDTGGEYEMFYRIRNEATGKDMFLQEGENPCYANLVLKVNGKPTR